MKFFAVLLFFLTITGGSCHAQHAAQKQANAADQLGMSCAQILQMSSIDWVTQFNGKVNQTKNANPGATGRADEPATRALKLRTSKRSCAQLRPTGNATMLEPTG